MSICTARATGAAAVALTVEPGRAFALLEIRIHLSAAGAAGNLTIDVDNAAGSAYDSNLVTQDMTSVTNYVLQTTAAPRHFDAGDKLVIAWANASTRTYGIEVKYSLL